MALAIKISLKSKGACKCFIVLRNEINEMNSLVNLQIMNNMNSIFLYIEVY